MTKHLKITVVSIAAINTLITMIGAIILLVSLGNQFNLLERIEVIKLALGAGLLIILVACSAVLALLFFFRPSRLYLVMILCLLVVSALIGVLGIAEVLNSAALIESLQFRAASSQVFYICLTAISGVGVLFSGFLLVAHQKVVTASEASSSSK